MRHFEVEIGIGLVNCTKSRVISVPDEAVNENGWPSQEYLDEVVWQTIEVVPNEISEEEAESIRGW